MVVNQYYWYAQIVTFKILNDSEKKKKTEDACVAHLIRIVIPAPKVLSTTKLCYRT